MSVDSIPNWIMALSGVFVAYITWQGHKENPKPNPKNTPTKETIKEENINQDTSGDTIVHQEVKNRGVLWVIGKGSIIGTIVMAVMFTSIAISKGMPENAIAVIVAMSILGAITGATIGACTWVVAEALDWLRKFIVKFKNKRKQA